MFVKNKIFINLPILFIFFIFLITGIIIYDDYGISWDEYFNRVNGFVSLNSIRKIFSLDIVYPELAHSTKSFSETAKIYGVIFDLPMAFIEKKLSIEDPKIYFTLRHLFNFLIFFISSIFFYFILKKRFSNNLSLVGLLFLILSPRIFAESFYNMKDIVFLSFFIISIFFAINFLDKSSFKNIFFSSLTCSFVVATKVIGIIVPFIIFVFFILKMIDDKNNLKRNSIKIFKFFTLFIVFTIIFWPYLWSGPFTNFLHALKIFSSHPWTGAIFYLGNYISALNLPWHYPIVWILISIPIIYLLLFILGSTLILRRLSLRFINLSPKKEFNDLWRGNKERMDIIFFLIFYFTLFLVIELNATLYNGWRHLYFLYPCLIFISIRGLEYISKTFYSKYLFIIIFLFLINTGFWMFKNHPYQFVYFNKFAGKSVANYFELDYWGNSNRSALTFISKNDNRNNIKVYVFSNSPYHFSLLLMDKEDQNRIKFVNKLNEADYLVTNHFYIRNNPIILNNKLKKEYKLLKEFKVDEMIINSVYKIN